MSENYTPSGKRTERVGGNARGGKHEDEVLSGYHNTERTSITKI